jgi:hypothetical protein
MEKIKNICITVSIILLILLFFIYCTQINNPPYIKEYLDTQTLDKTLDTQTLDKTLDTEKKMCDEGCYLAPINTQIININTRLDSLEKLNVLQDTKINNNIVNLTAMEDKIKKTEDELNKAMSPQK